MRLLFIALAAVTTVTLLAVHLAAITGFVLYDSAPWIGVIVLPGIFLPWLGFIVQLRKKLGMRAILDRRSAAEGAADSREPRTWPGALEWLMRLVRLFPVWARCIIAAEYAYFLVLVFSMSGGKGQAVSQDGRFVLEDAGRFVRYLSESEYKTLHAHDARVMSGCALIFTVIPLLFFLVGRDESRGQDSME